MRTRDKKPSLGTPRPTPEPACPGPPSAPRPADEADCPDRNNECQGQPTRVVERTWYFDCDDKPPCRSKDPCQTLGEHPGDPTKTPGRPARPSGSDNGRLGDGNGLNPGDINKPNPPGQWVGPRSELDLPYLFMRANAGDLGARPIVNAPFWESPDIFILAGVDPPLAPARPPALGETAIAGRPNTIYAHVWNFGNAAANEVLVEFYWVNPSLGISSTSVNLIAQTVTALGAKGSGHSHTLVKCPVAWIPTLVNGGHECLLVRIWDNPSDLPGQPLFDASWNRHVAQRNIHVAAPGEDAGARVVRLAGHGPAMQQPILLKVGPLFGAPATVAVERVAPSAIPWLQLRTGTRGVFPAMAIPTGAPVLSPPGTTAGGFPTTGAAASHNVTGDDQHIAFSTTDSAPGAGEAHTYRISATQDGKVFGGYTVVILG